MNTTIRCTRCGTVTTWTPYCPSCGAYLEFAGEPPWTPAAATEESSEESSEAPSDVGEPGGAESAPPTPAPVQPVPIAPPKTPPKHARRRIGGTAPWWRFWGRTPTAISTEAPTEQGPEGPTSTDHPEDAAFTYVVEAPAVPESVSSESPARQEALQQRTVPLGRADDLGVPGGMPCPNCKFRNYVDASYCARCGYTLRSPIPATQALAQALAPSEKPPRRTDWSFLALVALGVLILGIILFSPPGEPVRQTVAGGIRSIAYWIDPDLGTPVTITNVVASSTGYGYPPTSVIGDDSSSFWASAPGPSWGAGSTLTFTFDRPSWIDRMVIRPGIQNGQFAVRALATPENLTLVFIELDSDTVPSASPSPSASITDTTSPSPSPETTPTPSPSGSTSASSSPSPTPTATPSVQASIPVIVEPPDWATVVTFPNVYTDKVVVRVDTIYPPALPDVYAPGSGGQVAISGIQFLPVWTLTDLFDFDFREPATEVPSPSPSPSASTTDPVGPSPSASPSSSATPSS